MPLYRVNENKEFGAKSLEIYIIPELYRELVKEGYISESGEILLEDASRLAITIPGDKQKKTTIRLTLRNTQGVTRASVNGEDSDHGYPTFKFDKTVGFKLVNGKVEFDTTNPELARQYRKTYKYDIDIIEKNNKIFEAIYREPDGEKFKELYDKIDKLFNGRKSKGGNK
jgi:hypothetical protein